MVLLFVTTSVHVARFNGPTSSPRFTNYLFFCNISLGLATNQITTYNEYVYLTSFSLPIKNIIFSKWGHNPHNLKIEHGMIFFLPSTSRSSVISAQKAITTPITLLFFRHKNTSNGEEKGDSGYHCSKISGSQQSFLTFALSNSGRKVWATVLFLWVIMYRKVRHVHLFAIFCYICRTTVYWDPETMATKATWSNDFSSLCYLYSLEADSYPVAI